jgi:PAS domain S-box-containing protein
METQLKALKKGDHLCPVHESLSDQTAVAVAFIKEGLLRGKRCVHVAEDSTVKRAKQALVAAGVDAAREVERGALHFLTGQEAYLRSDTFDPHAMIAFIRDLEATALADGYKGLRFIGEMTGILGTDIREHQLIAYEALLNEYVEGSKTTVLCQYQKRHFDSPLIHDILRTHPSVMLGDMVCINPYYEPPHLLLKSASPERAPAGFKRQLLDWRMKRLEEANRERVENESLLRIAGQTARLGGWSVELPGLQLSWSDETCAIHEVPEGTSPSVEEALAFYAPESKELMEACFSDCAEEGIPFDVEMQIITAKGRRIWVRAIGRAVRNASGAIARVQGAFQDIDDIKRNEFILELRDRAIRAVSQAILITDVRAPDNPIIYASPSFEQMTGYPTNEVIGRNPRFLQGKDTNPAAVAQLHDAVARGVPCTVELLNYRKDGNPFWSTIAISPVLDADNQISHYVGVQTDVTERRRLEDQLRQSQKMEAIGQLAGGIAHDFNNLLTVINGYSDVLIDSLPADDPSQTFLKFIKQAGEQSAALTNQLLAFSKNQFLAPKAMDLNQVVRKVETMLRRIIGEDIALSTALAPNLGSVIADQTQMEQILMNLAVNARDAMPQGGSLTIETKAIDLDENYARTHPGVQTGSYVQLSVTDTGTGMPEEVKQHIFEPFYTTKGVGKGTGLGLSVVHGIVRQSDGFIEVYSEVGHGTCFKIYLPQATGALDGEAAAGQAPPASLRGSESILLVEDEPNVREFARHVLESYGYKVIVAGNAKEALERSAGHPSPIQLLLTDVVMPGTGGRSLAEQLKAARPEITVLFMSGYTEDAVVRHGILHESMNFLQKPFSPLALATQVRNVLDERLVTG